MLRQRLRAAGAWGYVFVNEAWVTSAVRPLATGEVTRVIDLPRDDRAEIALLVGVVKGDGLLVWGAPLEATPTGRRVGTWDQREPNLTVGDAGIVLRW